MNIEYWKDRALTAEQKLREAQEQSPSKWLEVTGATYDCKATMTRYHVGGYYAERAELIEQLRKDKFPNEKSFGHYPDLPKLYAAPIPPADVAELRHENEQYAKDVLQLIKQLRYCIGIAERGTGREQREDEVGELFLLEYVKGLERKLAEQQAIFKKIQYLMGISDKTCESLQYSGEELTNLIEEAKRQAVPEGWKLVPIEPTDSLIAPFVKHCCENPAWVKQAWREAMLAAAPQPEGVDK